MPAFATATAATGNAHAHALYWSGSISEEKAPAQGLPRYWPSDLLYAFTLRMAARGQCVSASMMLGDRSYALAQLRHAHAVGDEELRALVVQLFGYFSGAGVATASRAPAYAN